MDTKPTGPGPTAPKGIQHSKPNIGRQSAAPTRPQPAEEPGLEPLPVAEDLGPAAAAQKSITAFGKDQRHEEKWSRTPNTTGQGAIHVRTFQSKLTEDALVYMDQVVNEWLDAHPQYEVKFVNSTVGILTGKLKEPHLICQVWV